MFRNQPLRLSKPVDPGSLLRSAPSRWLVWLTLLGLVAGAFGCRSRAKQDVYVQKLTTELRLMEDQLYEADYRNRILAEKLEREKRSRGDRRTRRESTPSTSLGAPQSDDRILPPPSAELGPVDEGPVVPPPSSVDAEPSPLTDPSESREPVESPSGDDAENPAAEIMTAPPSPDPSDMDAPSSGTENFDMGNGLEDFDLESAIDPGQPVAPEEASTLPLGNPIGEDGTPQTPSSGTAAPEGLPGSEGTLPAPQNFNLPPSEPEPPGKEDLEIPPVVPGEIIPPPSGERQIEEPPGKVPGLPSSLDDLGRRRGGAKNLPQSPDRLSLHPGFSGPHQFHASDHMDGLMLVLTVLNDDGRMIDAESMDLDAELTIVAIDPTKPGTEARLARWDFDATEVRQLIQPSPVSGFHVPVIWDGPIPNVDEVMIHARLQSESERFTCQGRLNLARNARVSQWSPRAASTLERSAPTAKAPLRR